MEPFSILYRIEWVETKSNRALGARDTVLSVSCIGSNGLKLCRLTGSACAVASFSILYRIEWVETPATEIRHYRLIPFSILYRIEWVETWPTTPAWAKQVKSFSILYRIEWVETVLVPRRPTRQSRLSVSCIGSNGLKPQLDQVLLSRYCPPEPAEPNSHEP